jgi:dihydroneopterin aldolase
MEIEIRDLEIKAILGILEHERVSPQRVIVDLKIVYEYKSNIFIDYAKVVNLVTQELKTKKYGLIEEALEGIFELLSSNFPEIKTLYCQISKPDILSNCIVSVKNSWRC